MGYKKYVYPTETMQAIMFINDSIADTVKEQCQDEHPKMNLYTVKMAVYRFCADPERQTL